MTLRCAASSKSKTSRASAGSGNDVGSRLGVLREGALLEEGGDAAERGDIGARGQKFQKFTTGG